MRFALILSIVLAVLAVLFALQNPAPTRVELGTLAFESSTALILMVTFGLGVLVGILATVPSLVRRSRRIKALEREQTATASLGKPYTSDPDYLSSSSKQDLSL